MAQHRRELTLVDPVTHITVAAAKRVAQRSLLANEHMQQDAPDDLRRDMTYIRDLLGSYIPGVADWNVAFTKLASMTTSGPARGRESRHPLPPRPPSNDLQGAGTVATLCLHGHRRTTCKGRDCQTINEVVAPSVCIV